MSNNMRFYSWYIVLVLHIVLKIQNFLQYKKEFKKKTCKTFKFKL